MFCFICFILFCLRFCSRDDNHWGLPASRWGEDEGMREALSTPGRFIDGARVNTAAQSSTALPLADNPSPILILVPIRRHSSPSRPDRPCIASARDSVSSDSRLRFQWPCDRAGFSGRMTRRLHLGARLTARLSLSLFLSLSQCPPLPLLFPLSLSLPLSSSSLSPFTPLCVGDGWGVC